MFSFTTLFTFSILLKEWCLYCDTCDEMFFLLFCIDIKTLIDKDCVAVYARPPDY